MCPSVSGLDAHSGFVRLFFECPIGRTNKTERPKKWARQNKFVQVYNRPRCCISSLNINIDKLIF